MEIHPPERPIHSVKDFLLQLTAITIGILIALSLDGVLQWSHHRALVAEAKARLAEEMRDNTREVNRFLKGLPALKQSQDQVLQFIDDILGRKQMKGSVTLTTTYNMMSLTSTSWTTAQTTGALGYMEYADVQKYASAYNLQAKLQQLQDRVLENYIAGVLPPQDPDKASERELQEWKQNTLAIGRYVDAQRQLAEALLKEYDKVKTAR